MEGLTAQGFVYSKNDYSLFIKKHDHNITIVVLYVDGILLTGTDLTSITILKSHLNTTSNIKELGILH